MPDQIPFIARKPDGTAAPLEVDASGSLKTSGGGGGASGSTGYGPTDSNTTRVTLASDGTLVDIIGDISSGPATSDTGFFNINQLIKRGLQNWTVLLNGGVSVNTLAGIGVPRVQATSATAANIVLTTTCRRVSMLATTGTWYSLTGTATASSHYISAGERLDFSVPASTTISVLQETSAGSVRISELI